VFFLHNSAVLTISVPTVIKFGGGLTNFGQKQVWTFCGPPCTVRTHRVIAFES